MRRASWQSPSQVRLLKPIKWVANNAPLKTQLFSSFLSFSVTSIPEEKKPTCFLEKEMNFIPPQNNKKTNHVLCPTDPFVQTAQINSILFKTGLHSYPFFQDSSFYTYSKNQTTSFSKPTSLTVSFTALISRYVEAGHPGAAMAFFEKMQSLGVSPDQVTFVTAMSACLNLGNLDYARNLFFQMPDRTNVVAWNVMISGHSRRGKHEEAIYFFTGMLSHGVSPSRSTLASVLTAAASSGFSFLGRCIHSVGIRCGLHSNVFVASSLVNMYGKCGQVWDAKLVFDGIVTKNIVLWNSILSCFSQSSHGVEVFILFTEMRRSRQLPDEFTYTSLLPSCSSSETIPIGCQLHAFILKTSPLSNIFVGNSIMDMYMKNGFMKEGRKQFFQMKTRDIVSWNSVIVGHVQAEEEDEAFLLFRKMVRTGLHPDEVSIASLLSACAGLNALQKGEVVHCLSVKLGLHTSLFSGSSLVDMYVKCGDPESAEVVHTSMPLPGLAAMNSLLSGYAGCGNLEKAASVFKCMCKNSFQPTDVTLLALLRTCGLTTGVQVHCLIFKNALMLLNGSFLGVSLLSMYMNSGEISSAFLFFSELPQPRTVEQWTVMISGCTVNQCSHEGLMLYSEMRRFGMMMDQAAAVSVLHACAAEAAKVWVAKEVHCLITRAGLYCDELVCSALLDAYAKCGDTHGLMRVFEEMSCRNDVIVWNSVVVGLAKNGYVEEALREFRKMREEGVRPDGVTFLAVLTACSHGGKVGEGLSAFRDMVVEYGVKPRMDHFACVTDLLGRGGFLREAEEFILRLSVEPEAMIWASLLAGCRLHGDGVRGTAVAEKLMGLEPWNSSPYVLLASLYAACGEWDGASFVRREMREKGVRKFPGCSWISVGGKTSMFVAGDYGVRGDGGEEEEARLVLRDLTFIIKESGSVNVEGMI